jgi:hypothetical protein
VGFDAPHGALPPPRLLGRLLGALAALKGDGRGARVGKRGLPGPTLHDSHPSFDAANHPTLGGSPVTTTVSRGRTP